MVEDDPLLRMVAAEYLEGCGFSVVQAANTSEAIDQLVSNREIGVVFTDVDMPPGMNGLELAQWVGIERPGVKVLSVRQGAERGGARQALPP